MTDNSRRRCWSWFSNCLLEAILVGIAVLGIGAGPIKAAELWQFVQVGPGVNDAVQGWAVEKGKAQVGLNGDRIEILAYYDGDAEAASTDIRRIARIAIRGTIAPSGTIKATFSRLGTDAGPAQVTGRYTARTEHETWGTSRKVVTYKEIVFSYLPNRTFLGFLGKEARDQ
jgi:hypothetical protein